MTRWASIADKLAISEPKIPPEILAAVFSAACESGLALRDAFDVAESVAHNIDADIAREVAEINMRLDYSVNRPRTYAALIEGVNTTLMQRLLENLAGAEQSGEELVTRSRQIFEDLSAQREERVNRRAETYPLIMIVIMVIFFLTPIVVLIGGPLYETLLSVLNSL
jgi:pilus assembly protein TadC